MTITFSGRTALVAGGSRGIGAAVCRQLLQSVEWVALTHTGSAASIESVERLRRTAVPRGANLLAAAVDCTDAAGMARFTDEVRARAGSVDYLVYCAGFTSPVPLEELTVNEWRRGVDVNLTGAFLALRAVLPAMAAARRGSIVLIGSASVHSGGGGRADYVSAKAGLEGLNLAITREYGPLGIRSNLVHPSLIDTDLLRQRHPGPGKRERLAAGVPLGRLGTPDDVANLVCYLLSDQAAYITGQSILADGGRTFCGR